MKMPWTKRRERIQEVLRIVREGDYILRSEGMFRSSYQVCYIRGDDLLCKSLSACGESLVLHVDSKDLVYREAPGAIPREGDVVYLPGGKPPYYPVSPIVQDVISVVSVKNAPPDVVVVNSRGAWRTVKNYKVLHKVERQAPNIDLRAAVPEGSDPKTLLRRVQDA